MKIFKIHPKEWRYYIAWRFKKFLKQFKFVSVN